MITGAEGRGYVSGKLDVDIHSLLIEIAMLATSAVRRLPVGWDT